jgi:heptosyltransferase-3
MCQENMPHCLLRSFALIWGAFNVDSQTKSCPGMLYQPSGLMVRMQNAFSVLKMGTKLKILILRPSALGDTLMLLPALAQLRPLAEVIVAGRRPGLDFLKPYIHSRLDYEGPGWHRLFLETIDPGTDLPIPPIDHVVAFLNDPEGRVKVNLKTCLPKTPIHIFPPFPPEGSKIHVALYLCQCLQRSGLPIDGAESIEAARRSPMFMNRIQRHRRGKIIFHPGSGGLKKNHPPDFWLELIKQATKRPHYKKGNTLLLLGPAEKPFHGFFKKNIGVIGTQILNSPDREALVSLLSRSPLYFGQDSGITHLAAMHGTPTIALFKNSSISQWKPIGPAVRVIEDTLNLTDLIRKTLEKADNLLKETVVTQ